MIDFLIALAGLLVGASGTYTYLRLRRRLIPPGVTADTVAAWQTRK